MTKKKESNVSTLSEKNGSTDLLSKVKLLLFQKGKSGILIVVSIVFLCIAFYSGAHSLSDAYHTTKERQADAIYDSFYQKSYAREEAKVHVTNIVSVTVEEVEAIARLEVLKVNDVEYSTEDSSDNTSNITSWLEVPGTGIFTVDLRAGEYIVDSQRQYVLVRIPLPVLSEVSVDYAGINRILWKNDIFNDSVKAGEDLAREQIKEAELALRKYMASNRNFFESAKASAEKMIISLIRQFNPDVPDLVVEVEFYK